MDNKIEKKTCPKCGNPNCEDGDEFCFNCGATLKNSCINQVCNGYELDLPDDFCFCPICGEKTYFYEQGYIQPKQFKQGD